jgi:hypothetical protein
MHCRNRVCKIQGGGGITQETRRQHIVTPACNIENVGRQKACGMAVVYRGNGKHRQWYRDTWHPYPERRTAHPNLARFTGCVVGNLQNLFRQKNSWHLHTGTVE